MKISARSGLAPVFVAVWAVLFATSMAHADNPLLCAAQCFSSCPGSLFGTLEKCKTCHAKCKQENLEVTFGEAVVTPVVDEKPKKQRAEARKEAREARLSCQQLECGSENGTLALDSKTENTLCSDPGRDGKILNDLSCGGDTRFPNPYAIALMMNPEPLLKKANLAESKAEKDKLLEEYHNAKWRMKTSTPECRYFLLLLASKQAEEACLALNACEINKLSLNKMETRDETALLGGKDLRQIHIVDGGCNPSYGGTKPAGFDDTAEVLAKDALRLAAEDFTDSTARYCKVITGAASAKKKK